MRPIWILAVALIVLMLGVWGFIGYVAWSRLPPAAPAVQRPEPMDREDFRRTYLGQSPYDIRDRFGPPTQTTGGGLGKISFWYFKGVTINPATGRPDSMTVVRVVNDDIVTDVDYP